MLLPRLVLAVVLSVSASFAAADSANPADRSSSADASDDPLQLERDQFPRPKELRGNIAFWRKIFADYSRHHSVVHDIRRPERVYQVLDFRESARLLGGSQLASLKNSEEANAKIRIAQLLTETAALIDTPDRMSEDQQRLAALFAEEPAALLSAANFVRVQRGLRESTSDAMTVSGAYLPTMEKIFEEEGMPRLLTRLPFVESSFNVDAYSKVAAAGIWQFMPDSAKRFMRFNALTDDRKDPWRSSRAAAQHFKEDYRVLRDWPLAVTAYNYGRGGLLSGLREVGGNSLVDLIQRYNNPRFGFASRNFYAEFLAATDVERDWRDHFDGVTRRDVTRFDEVTLPRYTPWRTLVDLAGIPEKDFKQLNPAYRDSITNGTLYVPAGDTIRVPQGKGAGFRSDYAALGDGHTFLRQRQEYSYVKVSRGDTLAAIAGRHGLSASSLQHLNGLKKPKLRAGMRLKVPYSASVELANPPAVEEIAVVPSRTSTPIAATPAAAKPVHIPHCKGLKGKKLHTCNANKALAEKQAEAQRAAPTAPTCTGLKGKHKAHCLAQPSKALPASSPCDQLKGKKKQACEAQPAAAPAQTAATCPKQKGKKKAQCTAPTPAPAATSKPCDTLKGKKKTACLAKNSDAPQSAKTSKAAKGAKDAKAAKKPAKSSAKNSSHKKGQARNDKKH